MKDPWIRTLTSLINNKNHYHNKSPIGEFNVGIKRKTGGSNAV